MSNPDHLAIMRADCAALVADDCPVCAHPRLVEIHHALYFKAWDNQHVGEMFGISDGGPYTGEIIRQHRLQGHAPSRDEARTAYEAWRRSR